MKGTTHRAHALTAAILSFGCALAGGTVSADFQQGEGLDAGAVVESIRVTLRASTDADLRAPVALDLGLGFPLWLQPVGRVAGLPPFGAVPQESTAGTTIPAGQAASFVFRVEGELGQDRLRTTPTLLAGVRVSDIERRDNACSRRAFFNLSWGGRFSRPRRVFPAGSRPAWSLQLYRRCGRFV